MPQERINRSDFSRRIATMGLAIRGKIVPVAHRATAGRRGLALGNPEGNWRGSSRSPRNYGAKRMIDDIYAIVSGDTDPHQYSADALAAMCQVLNRHYRAGEELVSDAAYDALFVKPLGERAPDHPFFAEVEPESGAFGSETVRHAQPMLSTDKAYSEDELARFIARARRTAIDLGVSEPALVATPKLDGIAGMDRDDGRLVTRGDGHKGADITHAFERGLIADGGRGQGAGELVLDEQFFKEKIERAFEMRHPRNFIAGFVSAETCKPHHRLAAESAAVVFVPYAGLPRWEGSAEAFMADWEGICQRLRAEVPYRTDGVVLSVSDALVREAMGATNHHYRWQVAVKTRGEVATTVVRGVRAQTGRTGRVTPVLEIEPVYLAGAWISNVTAHTAATLEQHGLGVGARIGVIRAGEVIPKLEHVEAPAPEPMVLDTCPSCGEMLQIEGEYKVCPNTADCPAQAESRLRHWFKTLGNADLFGPVTVARLVDAGYTDLSVIYSLEEADFRALGFGPGQSANLVKQLERSRTESVQDWRFLAAFGLRHLGRGDARKLLSFHALESLPNLTAEQIEAVPGFGAITAPAIARQLQAHAERIALMLALGFNLERTAFAWDAARNQTDGPLAGESVVFTGKLSGGARSELEEQARGLGARVQSAVNGSTTLLVCGERAGSKRRKAEKINEQAGHEQIAILTEAAYQQRISRAEAA